MDNISKEKESAPNENTDLVEKYYRENHEAISSMLGSFAVKISIKEDKK